MGGLYKHGTEQGDDLRQPFPASGALHQLPVRANGIASQPLWAPDGKELFYNPAPAELAWVSVMTQPTITFGNPETVPRPFRTGSPAVRRAFDITPGGRFVGLSQEGQTESGTLITPQIQVVLNWFEELKDSCLQRNSYPLLLHTV